MDDAERSTDDASADEPAPPDPAQPEMPDTDEPPSDALVVRDIGEDIVAVDPARLPVAAIPTATPSAPARGLAFISIVIGGLCGGLIGFAFTELQCDDGCTTLAGLGGLVGAVIGAVGVAVVAVLVLRAMDEWESVKDADAPDRHPRRG